MCNIKINNNEDKILRKKPRISVIIPTHNHAHFLPECYLIEHLLILNVL